MCLYHHSLYYFYVESFIWWKVNMLDNWYTRYKSRQTLKKLLLTQKHCERLAGGKHDIQQQHSSDKQQVTNTSTGNRSNPSSNTSNPSWSSAVGVCSADWERRLFCSLPTAGPAFRSVVPWIHNSSLPSGCFRHISAVSCRWEPPCYDPCPSASPGILRLWTKTQICALVGMSIRFYS